MNETHASKRKAVFIDKDGTLIPDIPYNVNPDLITINDQTVAGLRILKQHGYLLVVVSNQSGVARGYFEEAALKAVWEKINELLSPNGVFVDGFYYCPHHLDGNVERYARECDCRKPLPGMLLQADNDFNVDLHNSWMIGDTLADVEAGNRAGCKTVLVNDGRSTAQTANECQRPTFQATNVLEAARLIQRQLV